MKAGLREGVTTGSCAAAAALGSILWQKEGDCPAQVRIQTPAGRTLVLALQPFSYGVCGVRKDAGDDPDVTDGCMVKACVTIEPAAKDTKHKPRIHFAAGEGIGTVTAPGLALPVGEPAINPVPRQMIAQAITPYLDGDGACVTVSIPGGEELAKKTYNSRVGVEGGLSILGTSGIVKPMSEEAMKEAIALEMHVQICAGHRRLVFVPGGQAQSLVQDLFGEDIGCVLVGNLIGDMLDEAYRQEAEAVLVAGFAGKLVKLAADIMHTHSHVADGRRETLCTFAALAGADTQVIQSLYACKTVRAAADVLIRSGYDGIWEQIAQTAARNCSRRVHGAFAVGVLMFDSDGSILCQGGVTGWDRILHGGEI